jgi:low molecular weight protein-tyrosine phosphatase
VILFVCEGNVCRSPLAAGLLVRSLSLRSVDLPIASAGTHALVGEPMDMATALIATRFGVDPAAHRARQLTTELIANARLVLVASRRIRRAVVATYPPAVQYTFTIRQFARIMAAAGEQPITNGSGSESKVEAVRVFAVKHRGMQAPPDTSDDDVVDPHGRPPSVHELAARQMGPALEYLSVALGGQPLNQLTETAMLIGKVGSIEFAATQSSSRRRARSLWQQPVP